MHFGEWSVGVLCVCAGIQDRGCQLEGDIEIENDCTAANSVVESIFWTQSGSFAFWLVSSTLSLSDQKHHHSNRTPKFIICFQVWEIVHDLPQNPSSKVNSESNRYLILNFRSIKLLYFSLLIMLW